MEFLEAENNSVVQILSRQARADPHRVACVFRRGIGELESITRRDLWRRSAAFAARLRDAGATAGEPFIIALSHRPQMLYAFFGAMIAGMVPAFMPFPTAKQNPELFWESHRTLFALIGARQFLTYRSNSEMAEAVPEDGIVRYVEDIAEWFVGEDAPPPSAPDGAAIALLQHTSGTTGLKKGVMLSHTAILRQVATYATEIGFGGDDVVASWLPLYHDMGLIACLLMPLLVGARLILIDPFEWVAKPAVLLDIIAEERATFSWLPNFAFLHLVRAVPADRRWDLSSVKALINCSEPCKATTFETFHARFAGCGLRPNALQVCYAMAENVFAVTQTRMEGPPRILSVDPDALEIDNVIKPPSNGHGLAMLSCGKPIASTAVSIRRPDRTAAGSREVGEIAIRTGCLFAGYNKLPDATAEKMIDGWYHTGDLGFADDGELFVTGRKDDLMIVYGRNYYAHAVEHAASGCAGVVPGRAVAFTIDNDASGSRDAVLLVEGDGTYAEAELRRLVKTRVFDVLGLTLYSVRVYARGVLVKSTAGKISRHHNKHLYLERTRAA